MNMKINKRLSEGAADFIDNDYLHALLDPKDTDPGRVRESLPKVLTSSPYGRKKRRCFSKRNTGTW